MNIFDVSTHLLPHVVACGDVLLLRDVWASVFLVLDLIELSRFDQTHL